MTTATIAIFTGFPVTLSTKLLATPLIWSPKTAAVPTCEAPIIAFETADEFRIVGMMEAPTNPIPATATPALLPGVEGFVASGFTVGVSSMARIGFGTEGVI